MIALLCAALAWGLAQLTPAFAFSHPVLIPIAALLVLSALALEVSGLLVFRKAKTTVNPLSPERSTTIVRSGPYRFTRNPMYLGMALLLSALCLYLANPASLAAVVVFVAYITRFQILPEERLLLAKFGEAYAQYARSVRRWL